MYPKFTRPNFHKKSFVGLLTLLLLPFIGFSQPPAGGGAGRMPSVSIHGRVLDKSTNSPIEFATVALYNAKDSSLLSGVSTDVKGGFLLSDIKAKSYYLSISFMGYKNLKLNTFPKPNNNIIELKGLELESTSEQLGEVAVVAKNKSVDFQLDKKVIDVASQATAASATAVEVLENVPSVKVDIDGTVSLRGSSGFTVLIDGKPTPLESTDALRSIPASAIQKMEIITNPSAKFEPDGTSGIINIVMKKSVVSGMNGIVNTNMGSDRSYGGDFLFNYRGSKFSYNIGADYNKRRFESSSESYRRAYSSDTVITSSVGESESQHTPGGLKGGIDYDINPYDAISLGFRVGTRKMSNEGTSNYNEYFSSSNTQSSYLTSSDMERTMGWLSINGTYLHKFVDNTDHTFQMSGDFNRGTGEEATVSEQRNASNQLVEGRVNSASGPRYNGQARADYVLPFNGGQKFETGYMGRWETRTAESALDTLDIASGIYNNDPLYSYTSEAYQNIQALYAIYSRSRETFSYQVGLRGEYTYRDIKMNETGESFILDQWDYFPTIHLSYKLPKENQLALSYSRRIERVRPWDLHPFVVWVDAYNVRQGNPALENQYIDALELGYIKQLEKATLSLEGYYRITHNKIERISSVYEDNVMMQKPYNVGTDYTLGIEASINTTFFKFWEVNLMGTLYDYTLEGEFENRVFDKQSFNWSSRLNNTFRIGKNQQIQFNGQYNSKTATAQGENGGFQVWNGAYKIDFFEKKFSTILQVRDIFGTGQRENYTSSPTLYNSDLFMPKTPVFALTLSYRFNNYKAKRNGATQNGDMDGGGGEM